MVKYTSSFTEIPHYLSGILLGIYKCVGNMENEKVTLHTLSNRHIRRLFQHYVGIPPKLFKLIFRHQSILHMLNINPYEDIAGLTAEQGYFDQSHFIKEFKRFYLNTLTYFLNEFTCIES